MPVCFKVICFVCLFERGKCLSNLVILKAPQHNPVASCAQQQQHQQRNSILTKTVIKKVFLLKNASKLIYNRLFDVSSNSIFSKQHILIQCWNIILHEVICFYFGFIYFIYGSDTMPFQQKKCSKIVAQKPIFCSEIMVQGSGKNSGSKLLVTGSQLLQEYSSCAP